MATTKQVKEKWLKLKSNIANDTLVKSAIEDTKDQIVLLTKDQLLHGENKRGEALGFYKNKPYALKKYQLNPLAGLGVKDFLLTGSYYAGLRVEIKSDIIHFTSTDIKAKYLEKQDVLGLTPENKKKYVSEYLRPSLTKKIKDQLK